MKLQYIPIILFITSIALIATSLHQQPSPLSPRFNHVMLYVDDIEKSIDFYTTAFDVEVSQRLTQIREVAEDGTETPNEVNMAFLKFPGQDFVFEISERTVENPGIAPHYQHVGIDVKNIQAAADRAINAGATNFTGIRHLRGNETEVKNCFFKGPDGENIELMEILAGEF